MTPSDAERMATLEADVANICRTQDVMNDHLTAIDVKLDAAIAGKADRSEVKELVEAAHQTARDALSAAQGATAVAERRLPPWASWVFTSAGMTIVALLGIIAALLSHRV